MMDYLADPDFIKAEQRFAADDIRAARLRERTGLMARLRDRFTHNGHSSGHSGEMAEVVPITGRTRPAEEGSSEDRRAEEQVESFDEALATYVEERHHRRAA